MRKFLFILAVLLLFNLAQADMPAPPPSTFHIIFNGSNVTDNVFYAAMLSCYSNTSFVDIKNQTAVKHPGLLIEEYDASQNCTWYPSSEVWEEECKNSVCYFYLWRAPAGDFRLVMYLPSINRTFVSSTVVHNSLSSEFLVNISSSGEVVINKVREISTSYTGYRSPVDYSTLLWYALVLTLVIELAASLIYIHVRKLDKRILWSVALVNIISVPLLWFFLTRGDWMLFCFSLLFGEFAVFVFEALVIFLLNRKRIGIVDSFAMSFINNVLSFIAGIVLLLFIPGI
ncbi:MAG: hypothetical protein NTY73_00065 [Candidatus Micrarchaeota archaeon]|nr:hypothetical protein [Candidatus Micrarchaeota archaeon]